MLLTTPPLNSSRGKVLIDGDILAYRAAYSSETGNEIDAQLKLDRIMDRIVKRTCYSSEIEEYQVYTTGPTNFRNEIAVSYPYKGNRSSKNPPRHLAYSRWYLKNNYGAIVSENEEADDLIAIEATNVGPSCVVASIDKDMLQIPCYHYNINRDTWSEVSEFEGLTFFYEQILTGDAADHIIGLHGIGPVKAKKILAGCETEEELFLAVYTAYTENFDRVVENGRLLWLRRYEDQLWDAPLSLEELGLSKQVGGQD